MTPTGVLIFSMVSTMAGAGVSAAASLNQAHAAKEEAKFQARTVNRNALQQKLDNDYNISVAEANKREGFYQGNLKREAILRQGKFSDSSLTVKLASRGLDLRSSSDLLDTEALNYETEANNALYESAINGLGLYRQQSAFDANSLNAKAVAQTLASGYRAAGNNAVQQGYLGAAGSILQGAASASETYYSKKK